jgi:23S rRNA (cytosine1962-C5)-methyltransferase
MMEGDYQLIDSGYGEKLESFGTVSLIRPCAQAVWAPDHPASWQKALGRFDREKGWQGEIPANWTMRLQGLLFRLAPTPFGHLGLFPEHSLLWQRALQRRPATLLNLFAYSGGLTLVAAQAGIAVCHVDSSRGMVDWARENAALNGLETAPIRWIVDDVLKFVQREIRRGKEYEAIVLDPPSFGRGAHGEVFKIERDLPPLLGACRQLIKSTGQLLLTCHTPSFSPLVLHHLLEQAGWEGRVDGGELILPGSRPIPAGVFVEWKS